MTSQCYKHRSKGCEGERTASLIIILDGMRLIGRIERLQLLLERLLLQLERLLLQLERLLLLLLEQLLEVETDNNILV